jgi:hypothetical protein
MEHTIEHYLSTLVKSGKMQDGDRVILTSISRQVERRIGLTDRQYSLVKSKLQNYKSFFEAQNMEHLDLALDTLKFPLRSIDRTQLIDIKDGAIVVQFPFNKKMISSIEKISTKYRQFYRHEKGSNIHEFKMYEPLVYDLVDEFSKKNFVIDPELIEMYNQIREIKEKEFEFVPYITKEGLINVSDAARELALIELGEFNRANMIKYWDRADRYGYKKTPIVFNDATALAEHLANRNEPKVYVNPSAYTVVDIANAFCQLERFPLLVTLTRRNEFDELQTLFNAFHCVAPSEQILLDRVEDRNDPNYGINQFIKDKKFNNWLDKNIKIVYIFKNSLPKLLIKGDWRPIAHLTLNGEREQSVTAAYLSEFCDLSVIHDGQRSYWNDSMSRQLNQWV